MQQLTQQHKAKYAEFKDFVAKSVQPDAEAWDHDQALPQSIINEVAKAGYLGCSLPTDFGGQGWDVVTFGLLNEACGRGSSSLTSVFTVQAMVSMALLKWGTAEQRTRWLPPLAKGDLLAAFALTEPNAGSALQSLATEFRKDSASSALILDGTKQWITCGQLAGVFLVFGKLEQRSLACLVPRDAPGLRIEPIAGMMGFRAAGLARLVFDQVKVQPANVIGKAGFALSHVAPVGLQYGRISTACSALGLLRGCFEESIAYAAERRIADGSLGELGMVRSLIAGMGTDLEAGRLLCQDACRVESEHDPKAFEKVLIAKYFASRAAVQAAANAVQIRGASGCHASSAVSRYYRDSKIMEIIEGTTQIHEDLLGKIFVGQASGSSAAPAGKQSAAPRFS
jgi:alkylation response protein AidB-like acyl-CoA dehydrogenase